MEIIGVVTPPKSESEAYAATNARIDNIIVQGTTTEGNIELIDIRNGAYGNKYISAGEAVRGQIINLTEKSFAVRSVPDGAATLASLQEMGIYRFNPTQLENITDAPVTNLNQYATLINYIQPYNPNFILQVFMTLDKLVYQRIINKSNSTVYQDWYKTVDNTLSVANVAADAKVIGDTAFLNRTPDASTTLLSSLIKSGVYCIKASVMPNITDKPSGVSDNSVGTLMVFANAYASSFIFQYFIDNLGNEYRRCIHSNGTILFDWVKTYDNSYVETINSLKGKKLVTAGDSYTAATFSGDYADYNGKNYGYYIAQRNNMNFVNAGMNGSTMCIPTNASLNKHPFVVDRYSDVPADTDYLTIWFGINDAAYCTLGTINDEADNTFYGAWNKVLRYYLTNRPFMKVLLIVTVRSTEEFRQAVRDIATKWGYPYLDLMKDPTIPAFFEKDGMSTEARNLRRDAFGWNGPVADHPNPQWHEYASTIIEQKLRNI